MTVYYNEYDLKTAAWLRELIREGVIAPGVVDTRSIKEVRPNDLNGFTQCHFFAGIGVWSYALRLAGWPDDRPVWTGSCPCQPFSAAGRGHGVADERHLWPAMFHLITQRRPPVFLGEQVASKDGLGWFDTVHADLEGADYACRGVDICAAGVGAPHIRQRLFFVGHTERPGREGGQPHHVPGAGRGSEGRLAVESGGESAGGVADDDGDGRRGRSPARVHERRPGAVGAEPAPGDLDGPRGDDAHGCGVLGGVAPTGVQLADPHGEDRGGRGIQRPGESAGPGLGAARERLAGFCEADRGQPVVPSARTHWSDCEWIYCRDGKHRPVEPGVAPLAHESPARVVRLRGYGNAIVAEVAVAFIKATGLIK